MICFYVWQYVTKKTAHDIVSTVEISLYVKLRKPCIVACSGKKICLLHISLLFTHVLNAVTVWCFNDRAS